MKDSITREEAWALLQEYGSSENHVRHMLAVEAAMRAYARRFDENEDSWGAIGLAHDFDYDQFPDEHPHSGGRILREKGYSDFIVNTVLSHGHTDVPRDTPLAQALHAVDELTGFLVAVTLVRPTKDIREVTIKSVKKKWKDKAFAAAVDREEIERAAEALGVADIDLHQDIETVLEPNDAFQADYEGWLAEGNSVAPAVYGVGAGVQRT
jgi:predicted hydrolase (HD superfamily)